MLAAVRADAGAAVPIALHDGLIWAEVEDGGQTLHFVVDTGAASSCINLAAARKLGMPLGSTLNVAGVDGRATGYRCQGFHASIGGMPLPSEVVALDLSRPAAGCSQRIDGLIGADFFQDKVVRIDYRRRVLTREPALPGAGVPLRISGGVMCVQVAVDGGQPRWTRLDTGCTQPLVWCHGTGRRKGLGSSVALALFAGRALQADVAVGNVNLGALPIKIRTQEIFPGEAGLLGNAALSGCRMTIDGIGGRLELEPSL